MQEFEGTKIIISSSQISEQMAINEIYKLEPNSKVIMWFESGLLLVRVNETFESISKKIIDNNTVFIRHIFPVLEEVDINGTKDDLTTFKDVCEKMKYLLDKGKSFSVQIRLTKGCSNAYAVSDINLTVANLFTQKGFINDVRNPDQVISILIANNKAYIGISYAFQNLSSWPGGIHRFAFEEGQISRAEFKLLEAIELFKIRLPYNGQH
jgi:23S rRNA (cytidine2498-2'-O)-methyltransferase